jgi:hypothetical protein
MTDTGSGPLERNHGRGHGSLWTVAPTEEEVDHAAEVYKKIWPMVNKYYDKEYLA